MCYPRAYQDGNVHIEHLCTYYAGYSILLLHPFGSRMVMVSLMLSFRSPKHTDEVRGGTWPRIASPQLSLGQNRSLFLSLSLYPSTTLYLHLLILSIFLSLSLFLPLRLSHSPFSLSTSLSLFLVSLFSLSFCLSLLSGLAYVFGVDLASQANASQTLMKQWGTKRSLCVGGFGTSKRKTLIQSVCVCVCVCFTT